MKLICDRYIWDDNIELKDVNYFNDNKEIDQTVDLYPFLVRKSLEDTNYEFEKIDNIDQTLYVESSSKRFDLDDDVAYSDQKLSDFFQVYSTNPRVLWELSVVYGNETIFKGLLYKDNIRFPGREREIIKIAVVGYEQEFKNLCINKKLQSLPANDPLNWGLTGFHSDYFIPMLEANLPGSIMNNMQVSYFISQHIVAHNPYLFAPHQSFSNNTMVITTGYNCFKRDEIDFYTYFNSLLLSKGWVYYFYLGKLQVQERAAMQYPELVLDYNKVDIKHDVESQVNAMLVENIIIDVGSFYSNYALLTPNVTVGGSTYPQYVGGSRNVVYNETGYDTCHGNTNIIPFWRLLYHGSSYIYEIQYTNYKTFIRLDENRWNFNFREFHIFNPHPNMTDQRLGYDKQKSLFINPVINSTNNAGGLDINHARDNNGVYYGNGNFYTTGLTPGDNDFRYIGNPGCSLIRVAGTNDVRTYYDDINGSNFRDNHKGFLRSTVQIMFRFYIDKLITDPRFTIKIINYPYHDINNRQFAVRGLRYNEITGTSILKLQML